MLVIHISQQRSRPSQTPPTWSHSQGQLLSNARNWKRPFFHFFYFFYITSICQDKSTVFKIGQECSHSWLFHQSIVHIQTLCKVQILSSFTVYFCSLSLRIGELIMFLYRDFESNKAKLTEWIKISGGCRNKLHWWSKSGVGSQCRRLRLFRLRSLNKSSSPVIFHPFAQRLFRHSSFQPMMVFYCS